MCAQTLGTISFFCLSCLASPLLCCALSYFVLSCFVGAKGAFLARCEEEATSRRDGVSMEDMMPPSYSDEEEYGNGSEGSDSSEHDDAVTQKGKR